MSGIQRQAASSGSDSTDPRYAHVDENERKRKRMISNRESARRSRMRKQKQLEDLVSEVSNIQNQNAQVKQSIDLTSQSYLEMQSANNILRAQAMELTERLRSLNSVLQIAEEVGGFDVEIPEIPDPFLKPWQLPCPVQPIVASAVDMFQY